MWRACKNILPTNLCLCIRKVSIGDECGLCRMVKSSGHALWGCWLADAVWKEARISLPRGCQLATSLMWFGSFGKKGRKEC